MDIFAVAQRATQMAFHHITVFIIPVAAVGCGLAEMARTLDPNIAVCHYLAIAADDVLFGHLYRRVHIQPLILTTIMHLAQEFYLLLSRAARPLALPFVPHRNAEGGIQRNTFARPLPVHIAPSLCPRRAVAFVLFAILPLVRRHLVPYWRCHIPAVAKSAIVHIAIALADCILVAAVLLAGSLLAHHARRGIHIPAVALPLRVHLAQTFLPRYALAALPSAEPHFAATLAVPQRRVIHILAIAVPDIMGIAPAGGFFVAGRLHGGCLQIPGDVIAQPPQLPSLADCPRTYPGRTGIVHAKRKPSSAGQQPAVQPAVD